jgi:diguanylate cyclase (GGDEF)-like protein
VIDHDGHVVHLNPAWSALAGLPAGHARAHWTELVHRGHRDAAASRLRAAAGAAGKVEFECQLIAGDSEPRAFLVTLHPLANDPAAAGWLCTATDIHALRLREIALEQRESALTAMLDVSVDCIKVINLDGELVHLNKAGCAALGVPEHPPAGTRWLSLLPEDVRQDGEVALSAALRGQAGRFPGRSVMPGQPMQYWDNLLTPLLDPEGRPTAVLCVSREVTAEHAARESLRESEERLAIAARVGGLGIWDYDIVNDRLYCDESWYRIMGRDMHSPIRSIDEFRPFIHPDDADRATEVQRNAAELIASQRDYSIAFRIVRPDGEIRWVRSLAYLQQHDGIPTRAVGFLTDITDARHGELALRDANRALEDERRSLVRKVFEDPLTGIANRRHLDNQLSHIRRRTSESEEPLCIGMIDVDRFKQFNDRYGHLAGDAALRKIAAALQSVAGPSDLIARYGGEEFTFVLPGASDPVPFLERFAARIAKLAIPHTDSPNGQLTTSCGVVVCFRPDLSPKQLLKMGDDALYEAKLAGRDRYVVRIAEA